MNRMRRCGVSVSVCVLAFLSLVGEGNDLAGEGEPFTRWSLSKAIQMLNTSPWARQETYTTIVGGVGSGRSGEKEIYNRFYVRFLSAKPIREAFTRIHQILYGYDELGEEKKRRFDGILRPVLEMDVDRWVVVAKFIFPRVVDGISLTADKDGTISFELMDIPISRSRRRESFIIRSTFSVEDMTIDGKFISY